ncbi:MAG: hypothetical protein R2879_22385 [Saprospiraceae bacterium]
MSNIQTTEGGIMTNSEKSGFFRVNQIPNLKITILINGGLIIIGLVATSKSLRVGKQESGAEIGLIVGCWLLAVGCWLLAVGCWLLAVGCWLLAVGCWLLAVGYWLLAVGCWLLAVEILEAAKDAMIIWIIELKLNKKLKYATP